MKYIILTISILAISCSALDPCQNKDLFLKEHKTFVEETIKKSKDYSDEEWDNRNEEFDKLVNECYKNVEESMSKEEKKEFWIENSEYLAERLKTDGKEDLEKLKELISGFTENGSGIVEGLANAFGDDLGSTFGEFGEDLEDVFDDEFKEKMKDVFDEDFKDELKGAVEKFGESIESIADEFKDILEEKK